MRKRYLMSMMVIGVTLAMVGLGTFAYWSTSQSFNGNQIQTGTFTIYENLYDSSFSSTKTSLTLSGLIPSYTYKKGWYIFVANDKNSADSAKFTLDLNSFGVTFPLTKPPGCISNPDQATFLSNVNMTLLENPTDMGAGFPPTGFKPADGYSQNLMGTGTNTLIPALSTNWNAGYFNSNSPADFTYAGPLAKGDYSLFEVQASLKPSVTDACYQGATITFNAVVTANQYST